MKKSRRRTKQWAQEEEECDKERGGEKKGRGKETMTVGTKLIRETKRKSQRTMSKRDAEGDSGRHGDLNGERERWSKRERERETEEEREGG